MAMSRRDMLRQAACGFGGVALSSMLAQSSMAGSRDVPVLGDPHYPAKVKSVIFLYMDGGPSQVDTFDPKERLTKDNGKPFAAKREPTQFNNAGNTLGSPWKFNQYGESGIPVSDLFKHVAQHVDDLAVVRSMTSNFSEHTNANYFLHTGSGLQGRPSMGAWTSYGLGSENQDLPGFVVLNGGLVPPGGLDNFNSGFLPAAFQGSTFQSGDMPVANILPQEKKPGLQRAKLDLLASLDQSAMQRDGVHDQLESAIKNYELAFRMQSAVPDLTNLDDETAATKEAYGMNAKFEPTQIYARQCLLARRLVERGVRFIELTCPKVRGDRWDQHDGLRDGHEKNALAVDQPIGALLADLKQRGLFEETLVIWTGEFGRTPFAQGKNGRDHNPYGFSSWLAGGGIKGGTIYGATDEFGYRAIENKVEIHDLHATMLHLLGVDHERLTFRWSGRDMRLTDVHGKLIDGILA
ncbi:hypothetical protein MFFC18_18870 [Mariniblastus fucicola]|uniref:Sulfatase n=2 Tax=Mariniblastus fucicola TaxID=980251 RepID=A0A5B9PBZ7_9BACT|nr:hypothetical protein MFFC18_18870 [Mariniblastus fucicola]